MSHRLPPCDHDECPASHCLKAGGSLAPAPRSAFRWKPMDVAFGDNLHRPRRLILEVNSEYPNHCYSTCSESDGVGYHSDHSLRTKEEWLAWVDRFSDDLTGRKLREAKEAVRADFVEPDSWRGFRERFAATGDPWLRETPNAAGEPQPRKPRT